MCIVHTLHEIILNSSIKAHKLWNTLLYWCSPNEISISIQMRFCLLNLIDFQFRSQDKEWEEKKEYFIWSLMILFKTYWHIKNQESEICKTRRRIWERKIMKVNMQFNKIDFQYDSVLFQSNLTEYTHRFRFHSIVFTKLQQITFFVFLFLWIRMKEKIIWKFNWENVQL